MTGPSRAEGPSGWVLVTGASRGIGEAIARRLWADGFGVVLWARDAERLRAVARSLSAAGERVAWASVDVGDPAAVARAAETSLPPDRALVGAVINAGHGRWRRIEELDPAEWAGTLETNLTGAFLTLKAALPRLDFARSPIVMGILSDSALVAFPDRAAYASAKAGLQSLLDTLRREYRARGLRVCQLYPSRVDTWFAGSHAQGAPGMRPNGLGADQVADVASFVFAAPADVEIRALHLSSTTASFGLEEECLAHAR